MIYAWVANPTQIQQTIAGMRTSEGRIFPEDIYQNCLKMEPKEVSQTFKKRLFRIMTLGGWVKKRESQSEANKFDGVQREFWTRISPQ